MVKEVPVFVMLPLDVVDPGGQLRDAHSLAETCKTLRSIGVAGVMVDVWWGIVERAGPGLYDWSPYEQIVQIVKGAGLRLQAVMSFHACGGNVGDNDVNIPLPMWVYESAVLDPAIYYHDRKRVPNPECISLFSDSTPCLAGRTPVQVYKDFMVGFRGAMGDDFGEAVFEVAVGMGPCGELRYPSYPEGDKRWKFPGVGEFQCYDSRALKSLRAAADAAGHPEWGDGPADAGTYTSTPEETGFFSEDGSWKSSHGCFFLEWYSGALLQHGERMLKAAHEAFSVSPPAVLGALNDGQRSQYKTEDLATAGHLSSSNSRHDQLAASRKVRLSVKCAGIHWWYATSAHAAELTAGYWNAGSHDGYAPIADLCASYGADLNFTCCEMRDGEQPAHAKCRPQDLLSQVRVVAAARGVPLGGENALARLDTAAYEQMLLNACSTVVKFTQRPPPGGDVPIQKEHKVPAMAALTFLRLSPKLFQKWNLASFENFVQKMKLGSWLEEREPPSSPTSRHHMHSGGRELSWGVSSLPAGGG